MNSIFKTKKTLRLKDQLVDLSEPLLMGIVNVTPDSFFDGGKYVEEKSILKRAEQIVAEGGDIIDVGGYSSRPNAENISETEEIKRTGKTIEWINKEFPEVFISVDTFRSEVAKFAVEAGACLVNDISGGELDAKMFETIAKLKIPYILMHMRGNPQNMVNLNSYRNILQEIIGYFERKVHILRSLGLKDLVLDPGFGFSKNIQQNYYLLNHLECFGLLQLPLMVGISRKSLIYKTLHQKPEEALNGSSVLHTIALLKKAAILRVHDVKEAKEAIELLKMLN